MILNGKHYREVLMNELEKRQRDNPNFSMRAFAKRLELNPTTLSLVLNGKRSLSEDSINKICNNLAFNPMDSRIFHAMVLALDGRSPSVRLKYITELEKLKQQKKQQATLSSYFDLNLTKFKVISDWYNLTVLEALHLDTYKAVEAKNVVSWLSKILNLTANQVSSALMRLENLELVSYVNEKPKPGDGILYTGDRDSSVAIQTHHKQFLQKAIEALDEQSIDERDFSGIVLPVDESRIPEAKEMIKKFRKKMNTYLRGDKPTRVYRLSIEFFALNKKEKK